MAKKTKSSSKKIKNDQIIFIYKEGKLIQK